ncbi:hypothetical protein DYH10_01875 [Candidatus Saccharibacteria bacterium CPR2]|nr:hypothetical protein [Candidatus Saccharibacteria bacterium CPR2]
MIVNIFFGLILVVAGIAMLKFNYQISNMFSHNNWFERNFGSGATYIAFQLLGILVSLYGVFLILGLHDNIIGFLLSPITNVMER